MSDKTINNPLRLSDAEKPYYDMFVKEIGREPESFGELLGYSLNVQEANKQFRSFIGGMIGL